MEDDKMIIDLGKDIQNLLEKVKKELGQSLSDNEIIRDALMCYYVDIAQINKQKNKFKK
jgi:hypothetical protein